MNHSWERLCGYSAAEVTGKSLAFIQGHATDKAQVQRLLEDCHAGRPSSMTVTNYTNDGTPFTVCFSSRPSLRPLAVLLSYVWCLPEGIPWPII